jgi:hypothetical protein
MKREIFKFLAVLSAGSVLLTACTSRPRGGVVVTPEGQIIAQAPPEPRVEAPGAPPGSSYVWQSGYWLNQSGRWVWLPGHWEMRPSPGATWVPGHWDNTARGWVWTPGHWK